MVPHFAALSLAVLDITLIPRGCWPESLQRRHAKKELLKKSDWRRRSPGSPLEALQAETGCHADSRSFLPVCHRLVIQEESGSSLEYRACDKPDEDPDHTEAENHFFGALRRAAAVQRRLTSFFGVNLSSCNDAQRPSSTSLRSLRLLNESHSWRAIVTWLFHYFCTGSAPIAAASGR